MNKTFEDVSEVTNKCLVRCAGVVRKEGWPEGAKGMTVLLSGPTFYYHNPPSCIPGYYPREYLEQFMRWQEEHFGEDK